MSGKNIYGYVFRLGDRAILKVYIVSRGDEIKAIERVKALQDKFDMGYTHLLKSKEYMGQ